MPYSKKAEPNFTRKPRGPAVFQGSRYEEKRRCFPWSRLPEGLDAKAVLYVYARRFGTDDQYLMNEPGEVGLDFDEALAFIKVYCPEAIAKYAERMGKELTAKVLRNRFDNMFRDNRKKGQDKFAIGPEHPKNQPKLRGRIAAVEERINRGDH